MNENDLPNIILIILDCARPDHFGCYGYKKNTTPNIDRLAKNSMIYEQAISSAGWTLPSMTSLFTGTYPSKHGAHNENHTITSKYPLLAELLAQSQYNTIGICFDNYWVSEATGLANGFNEFIQPNYSKLKRWYKRILQYPVLGGRDNWGYEITRIVKQKINQQQQPFFLYMQFMELHLPFNVPAPHLNKFLPKGMSKSEVFNVNQDPKKYYSKLVSMKEKDFEKNRILYDAALNYLDTLVARVFDYFEKMNILENSIIIITSDHGESLGEHDHFDHYYVLYESLIRVPFIIYGPKYFGHGKITGPVQTLDLYPTLLKLAGVEPEKYNHHQGVILPPIDGFQNRDYTFAERFKDLEGLRKSYPDLDFSHLEKFELDRKKVIRSHQYKLIHSLLGYNELYDIISDPGELNDIYNERPEIVKKLETELDRWTNSFDHSEVTGEEPEFDDDMKDRLKSLGYLG